MRPEMSYPTKYHAVNVDGVNVFYREAGSPMRQHCEFPLARRRPSASPGHRAASRALRRGPLDGRVHISQSRGPGADRGGSVFRLADKCRLECGIAGIPNRAATAAIGVVVQVRSLFCACPCPCLSGTRSRRGGAHPERRPFCLGRSGCTDYAADAGFSDRPSARLKWN
jgi:hypothetical protein